MPPVRSLSDFLRGQPEDELLAMAESLRAEITRLQTELEIIETALNRGRRRSGAQHSTGRRTRGPGLKRSELLAIIREQGRPVRPVEMREILAARGIQMETAAIRTGMARLVDDGKIIRVGEGLYMVSPAGSDDNGAKNEEGAPLFRDASPQSQDSEASYES